MSVRYLNASGTQAVITEIKRRLSLKADSTALSDLAQTVADLVIPTKVSELENDSQFITLNDVADEYATKTDLTTTNAVVQQHTTAITLLNADSDTAGSVDYKIAQALAGVGGSPFIVVAALPTSDPSTEVIYILSTDWSMYIYRDNDFQRLDATLASTVAALVTTVGDSTDGLVKDVADINDTLDTIVGADTGSSMRDVAEDVVSAIPKAITPKGTIEFADLPALADSSIGDMYNIEDAFTTTADFIMGAGTQMQANSNVYVIDAGAGEKKWDVFATGGIADMSAYQTKELTSHSGITATTVEGALEEVASNIADAEGDVSDLQTTVGDATNGLVKDVADLDSGKQPKTLSSPIEVDDVQQTTVEGALTALANASGGGVTDEVAGHTLLWYAAVADLPTTTAGAIITGTRAWVAADNQLYVATVTGTSVTWAADSTYHLAVGSDYFHGTASTSQLNITSVGK